MSVTLAVGDCVRVCDAERDSLTDAEELSAGDGVADGDGAADEESEREGDAVPEGVAVNELLPLPVRDSLAVNVTEPVRRGVGERECEGESRERDTETVAESRAVPVSDAESLRDNVGDPPVAEPPGVGVAVCERRGVGVRECDGESSVGEAVSESLRVAEAEALSERETVPLTDADVESCGVTVKDRDRLRVGDRLRDGDAREREAESLTDREIEACSEGVAEADAEPLGDADGDSDGVPLTLVLASPVAVTERDRSAVGDFECDGESRVPLADTVPESVALSDSQTETEAERLCDRLALRERVAVAEDDVERDIEGVAVRSAVHVPDSGRDCVGGLESVPGAVHDAEAEKDCVADAVALAVGEPVTDLVAERSPVLEPDGVRESVSV